VEFEEILEHPSKLDNETKAQLLQLHHRCHQLYNKTTNFTNQDIIRIHYLISAKLKERGIDLDLKDNPLDRAARRFKKSLVPGGFSPPKVRKAEDGVAAFHAYDWYFNFMRSWLKGVRKVLLVPCAKTKPIPLSVVHRGSFQKLFLKYPDYQPLIVSEPVVLIRYADSLAPEFKYDFPPNLLNEESRELFVDRLRELLKGKEVIGCLYSEKKKLIEDAIGKFENKEEYLLRKSTLEQMDLAKIKLPSIVWIPKFISVSGSKVYAKDREPNDMDIIARAEEDGNRLILVLDKELRLKVDRLFRDRFGTAKNDVEWHGTRYGPNWKNLPAYDLCLVPRNPLQFEEMNEPEFAKEFYKSKQLTTGPAGGTIRILEEPVIDDKVCGNCKYFKDGKCTLKNKKVNASDPACKDFKRSVEKVNYRKDKCMMCDKPPEYEVLWAEGMARAWFCKDCLRKWVNSEHDRRNFSDINEIKRVEGGAVGEKWKDNTNPDIRDRIKRELSKAVSAEAKAKAEASKKEDKVVLFRFFYPQKTSISPLMGYRKGEKYSVEAMVEFLKDLAKKEELGTEIPPVITQKKYDGIHSQLHWDGEGRFKVFSDQGEDYTSRLPSLKADVKKLVGMHAVILDCEIEWWRGGVHQPREVVAGHLNPKSKEPIDDSGIVANCFDMQYYDGDIHKNPYSDRLKRLKSLKFLQSTLDKPSFKTSHLNLSPSFFCNTVKKLEAALRKCASAIGSEGAMVKKVDMRYTLTGSTNEVFKLKTMAEVHGIVWKATETKTKGVYNYDYALSFTSQDRVDPKTVVEVKGKKYTKVGRCFNTKVKVPIGGIITVKFHTVNYYTDPRTGLHKLEFYEPAFYEYRASDAAPDSFASALKIGRESGLLVEKVNIYGIPLKKDGTEVLVGEVPDFIEVEKSIVEFFEQNNLNTDFRFVEKDGRYFLKQDPYMHLPPEEKDYRYVIQIHFIRKSAHNDLRNENE